MGGQPVVALAAEHELEDAGEVVRVLADVVKVHDLGHFREHRMPISGAVAATLQAVEQPSISMPLCVKGFCRAFCDWWQVFDRRGRGQGHRVMAGSGSGWAEEPVPGV